MHIKTLAFVAFAVAASAENLRFTRISPPGLSRRDAESAYSPEETECGEGDTCAEACGSGFEECESSGGVSSCYNPDAGETCCSDLGLGTSCQAGYFCAHDSEDSSVCCAEGISLEDCAQLNGADVLKSDSDDSSSGSGSSSSAAAPTQSSGSSATASQGDEGEGEAEDTSEDPDSGAAGLAPGFALLAGAVAFLL